MTLLSRLYRISKAFLCAVCGLCLVTSAALAEIAASEMQAAMDQGRCPSDLAQVSFLDYKPSCGTEPSGASRAYLDCQNRVDRENNIISRYNEFVQKCAAARVERSTPNDLSKRLNSQQSITKQSEEQGTKERYQQQIQKEENQEAQTKQDENLAEQRRKYQEDLARQQATQAAERAKADAERQRSETSSAPPSKPQLVLQHYSEFRSKYYYLSVALRRDSNVDCRNQDGLNVCTIYRVYSDNFSDYSGQCVDVRDMYRLVCRLHNSFTDAPRANWENFDFCIDAVCFP